jgi:hypothetical protein
VRRRRRKKHARKEEEEDVEGNIVEADWGTADRIKIIGSRYKTRK